MSFGEWLKKERQSRGMSQAELARILGCSQAYVHNIEGNVSLKRGKVRQPRRETVERFVRGLTRSSDELDELLRQGLIAADYEADGEATSYDGDSQGDETDPTKRALERFEKPLLDRITVDLTLPSRKAVVRGGRLAVEEVLAMLAAGESPESILKTYSALTADDLRAVYAYARRCVVRRDVVGK